MEAIKEDTKNVKGDTKDIKEDTKYTKDIKEDTTILKIEFESMQEEQRMQKEMQQNLLKEFTQLKEHVTKKPMEKTERDNLSYPEEPNCSELYLFGFILALNVLNLG